MTRLTANNKIACFTFLFILLIIHRESFTFDQLIYLIINEIQFIVFRHRNILLPPLSFLPLNLLLPGLVSKIQTMRSEVTMVTECEWERT
jgi:hypothetical protein